MAGKHTFVRVLTGEGILSYLDDLLQDLVKVFLLQGATSLGRSLFLRLVGLGLCDRGYQDVEFFHSPFDHISLEGLVLREKGIGVFDGEVFSLENLEGFPGIEIVEEVFLPAVSLPGEPLDEALIEDVVEVLHEATAMWKDFCFHQGKLIDQHFLAGKVSAWAGEFLRKPRRLRRYFAVSLSPEGDVGFISNLSRGCCRRYLIRGVPGSGCFLLHQVLLEALSRHYQVEAYYSYLNPEDPVVVILPEERIAFIDTTSGVGVEVLPSDVIWETSGAFKSTSDPDGERIKPKEPEKVRGLLSEAAQKMLQLQQSGFQGFSLENDFLGKEVNNFISRILQDADANDLL
ncbi:MAG: Uncharacterized protein XD63_0744 [Thermoanaerobacterales bacterium 50_218]|nr:MAG: Uncharacterized protein XD63_0744 [Thermoanaerobacterales bacterium 50_218]HAA90168.1 hypothetical protein [Peptococcaceae bacterium]